MREVTARFSGVIRSVSKRVGDGVQQGETLATVESNESLQSYGIASPISGVVIARTANPGESVAEKPLLTVGDLSTVWIELSLFPRDVARIGFEAMMKGDGDVVTGWMNKLQSAIANVTPAGVLAEVHRRQAAPGSAKN